MNLRNLSREERLREIEKKTSSKLPSIDDVFIDDEKNVHCENLIGAVTIPLGIAGPMKINGDHVQNEYYIPLATSEGALVASVNRGCKVITQSGGANVSIHRVGTTRGPVFDTGSLKESHRLVQWIKGNKEKIKQAAESTSGHLTFKKVQTRILSNYVFARFYFNTEDAMGMNMVTIATQKIGELIEKETGIRCLALAGNFDLDKKPSWLNFVNNRGIKGWGEVIISKKDLEESLKTTPQKLFDVWLAKCMLGSAMSGSLGFNSHFANIVAAFFAATGQDLAHVVEGSHGITTCKILENGDIYFSVYLPAIMLGTVGGGTKLKTQTEARTIMNVTKSEELAEILVAAVLAGELSLLASISEQTLAQVHTSLGR